MEYVYVGKTEIKALIVGLLIVGLLRHEMAIGRPPKSADDAANGSN